MKLRAFVATLALALLALVAFGQTTTPTPPTLHVISPKAGEKVSANFVTVRWELLNPATSANAAPTYLVRLDGQDPIHTTDTEFTFSGLSAGRHALVVQLVDANDTPINGAHAEISFSVNAPAPTPTDATPDHSDIVRQTSAIASAHPQTSFGAPRLVRASLTWVEREPATQAPAEQQPPAPDAPAQPQPPAAQQPPPATARAALPRSATALPLLSVIGFGALLGGLASAMRTR
jgi:hypothetical protein